MSGGVRLRLETTREELARDQAAAGDGLVVEQVEPLERPADGALDEALFVETIAVIAVASLAVIAKQIVDHWLKGGEQGVQIDLRTTPPTISQIANVPRGYVVIVDRQGQASVQQATYERGEELQPLLTQLLGP